MIEFTLDDKIHGQYSVTIKCHKCNLAAFSGLSKDKENVERVIRQKFAEAHLDCEFSEVVGSADLDLFDKEFGGK